MFSFEQFSPLLLNRSQVFGFDPKRFVCSHRGDLRLVIVIRDVRGVRWMPRRGTPVLGSRNQRPGLRPGKLVRGGEQLLVLLATLALASSHHLDGDCVVH